MRVHPVPIIALSVALAACGDRGTARGEAPVAMKIESTAFEEGGTIPQRHTCDGDDVSPPLRWHGAPSGTQAFALIADDPDAPRGTWVHWVAYDLPADVEELPAGASRQGAAGATQGQNDFGRTGYGGPCPPPGPAHRYYFKLYALDQPLGLAAGKTKSEIEAAMEGHVLASAQLMGRYARAR